MPRMRKRTVIRKLLRYLGKYRWLLVLSIALSAATVVSALTLPILTGDAVDLLLGPGNVGLLSLASILIKMAAVIAATAIAQWLQNLCNNRLTYDTVRDIRRDAMAKLNRLPLSYLDSHMQGDLVSRIISDVDVFADGLLMGFTQLISGVLTVVGVLFFMFRENVPLGIVVAVLTPLSILTARFIARKSFSLFRQQSQDRGEQTALIEEMTEEAKLIRAYGREGEALERFRRINEKLGRDTLKATFVSSLTNPMTRFINNLVYAAVAIFGAFLAISGTGFTPGMLTAFLVYANQYTKPFNEISGVITELQNSLACADRVFALIEEAEEEQVEGGAEFDGKGELVFSDVAFSYQPEKPLITGFSLNVPYGRQVAIVGPTGAGKSTIINLLMRFYDIDSGEIRLSGQEIRTIERTKLRKNYGMVLQETWLKEATVRENIAYGKPGASEEEIIRAAKAAHAHGFIMHLENGYDTVISSDTGTLSAGQKQLLCIARAMLTSPDMLILDEATSSIDIRTEERIQDAFRRMMAGHTSFIVAHRLSTIRNADVILYLENGQVKEQGSHEELLQKGGAYAALYESQFVTTQT